MTSSKVKRVENDALKAGLCRHPNRSGWKMMSSKRVYAVIKRGAGGK
ncbi:hypothetical protein ACOJQI_12040 [Bacillus salacetis]